MINCLVVGIGGFIGSIFRYLFSKLTIIQGSFPFNTLLINIIGSLAIGIIAALVLKNLDFDEKTVLFLKVGICGGFTTFSTFALDSFELINKGDYLGSFLYILLSIVLSIVCIYLGFYVIKRL